MPDFNANNTFLERPGNFKVTDIHIIPYHREGRDEGLYRQIITDQVLGFNIYESMTSHFLSGDMTIIDGVNLGAIGSEKAPSRVVSGGNSHLSLSTRL